MAINISREKAGAMGRVLLLFLVQAMLTQALPSVAQQSAPSSPQISTSANRFSVGTQEIEIPPGKVTVEGRYVLTVYESVGTYTPEERAARITDRIIALARNAKVSTDSIRLQPRGAWTEILAEDNLLMAVTDLDAAAAGKPRAQLAEEYAQSIRQTVLSYRGGHSWNSILRGSGYTVVATGTFVLLCLVVRKLRLLLRAKVNKWLESRRLVEEKSGFHIAITYVSTLILAIGTILRWLFILAIFQAYLTIVLGFFSSTRSISLAVTQWLFTTLGSLGKQSLEYLPNVLVIAIICLISAQLIRLLNLVFGEIANGTLQINGFYPDWAEPTSKLIRILVIVLTIVVIFPYFPGSKSPAFQGISIFVGVLLSLGSSSAVANGIAGIILTYMRSFLVGDWVRIGDTTGEVIEKNMLVTRVLTPKREIITIPNAAVMSGSVMNFTAEAKKAGVIFHTTVTIGYDAPWRTVHQLLVGAALETKNILVDPAPFVLQTALNDFYVSYELNAYTDTPLKMQFIYSELHQHIQDKFNEAGVEICSPHFSSLRDGNTIAIPQQYVAEDYSPPGFRVQQAHQKSAQAGGRD